MKIALCLSGVIGSSNRWSEGKELDYSIGYEYLNNAIMKHADVDVFIHSWSNQHEEGLTKLYKPVDSIFETQIDFGYDNPKSFAIMSQGYTKKTAVRLALNYSIKNNFEYDFVVLTRLDLAWIKQIDFNNLNVSNIYAAGPEVYGKINDFFFIANSCNIEKLVNVYNELSVLEDLTISETKGTIAPSYHRAVWKHLQRSNLLNITKYILYRPWGNPKWDGDVRLLRLDPNVKYLNE